jgi:hypothetical protein
VDSVGGKYPDGYWQLSSRIAPELLLILACGERVYGRDIS